ncbi:MAG: hypothetical protein EXR69_13830 [Myxococcales bacterium]|nr:hypothetical protein [Myxococcales bacterium]
MVWALLYAAFPTAEAGASNAETPTIDVQHFRPSPDSTNTIWTDDTHIGPSGFVFRALLSYANDPLVYTYTDGRTIGLVTDLAQVDLLPSVRVGRVRVGVDLPLYPAVSTREQRAVFGAGDWRVHARVVLLDAGVAPVGVGVAGSLGLPTGTTDGLRAGGISGDGLLITDTVQGRTRLAVNAGLHLAPDRFLESIRYGDAAVARFGGSYALSSQGGVSAELVGSAPLRAPLTTPGGLYGEWIVGGWSRHGSIVARAGAGTGLTHGIGSPDLRVVVGFGWERPDGPADRDADGVPNRLDQCDRDPEDRDGVADEDGCAEPDRVAP